VKPMSAIHRAAPHSGASRQAWRQCGLLLLTAAAALAQPVVNPDPVVRIGVSVRTTGNTNRTDWTAAMKAWMQTVTQTRKLAVDLDPILLDSVEDMVSALRRKQIDLLAAPTDEYLIVEKVVPMSRPFATEVGGKLTEEYVVLVRGDRGFKGLKDLRGETLLVLEASRNALAPLWLETELLRLRLPVGDRFFGRITRVTKPSLGIVPVFFKQAAAALVNRRNFETAAELNPQLGEELRILATSPDLIPLMTSYRMDVARIVADNYLKEAQQLKTSASGRMILNLFQIDGLTEVPEPLLAETRSLVAEHAKLKKEAERKGGAP